jgi:phosphoribosyl 1,2-cyclic phosphate phosphodiesterase
LGASFNYHFDDTVRPYEGTSKPRLTLHQAEPDQVIRIAGIEVLPLAFQHGHLRVFGYRFGPLAYLTDIKEIGAAQRDRLKGLEVLVLNALWWRPHPTHLSISEAIETAQALGARRTYLTHLTHETGHSELETQLPAGVFPAYDGLTVEVR